MITFSYLTNPNMPTPIQHCAGNIDNFTLVRTKKFITMTDLLKFYNECFLPIDSLETIISAYNKQLKENKREIKQLFYSI